jgi:hypothetical protein
MDGKTKLFSADGAIVTEQKKYGLWGSGYELGSFLSTQMYGLGNAPSLSQLIVLALYIVYEAKIHAPGVGGDSHVVVLRNEGKSIGHFTAGDHWIDQHFKYLDGFLGPAFLASADIDTSDFLAEQHIEIFVDMLKMGRQEMKTARERAIAFTAKLQQKMKDREAANRPPRPPSSSQT